MQFSDWSNTAKPEITGYNFNKKVVDFEGKNKYNRIFFCFCNVTKASNAKCFLFLMLKQMYYFFIENKYLKRLAIMFKMLKTMSLLHQRKELCF